MWSLPISVEIGGIEYAIRHKCDYRVVLDVISALKDEALEMEYRIECALFIFYEDLTGLKDIESAIKGMMKIINLGEETTEEEQNKPQLMDWEHDFPQIAPSVNRVLGYSVRDVNNFTHWYDFVGAYMEIGSDCTFSNIVSIREKKAKGKKLEKYEQEFYKENRKLIDLPHKLTAEEEEFLSSDW
jgi:hypothetical protein